MGHSNLQYLHRNQIDTVKWDQCIDKAVNGLIYARSLYLDKMATNWDALVLGDYEAVMPLTWRMKWGIKYLYQPAFTQQLGIFTGVPVREELVITFTQGLLPRFKFAEIFLNYAHPAQGFPPCANYILPLQLSYDQLRAKYKQDLVKNLNRCNRFDLAYSDDTDLNLVLAEYKVLYGSRTPHVTDEDHARFKALCTFLPDENKVIRVVKEGGQLLSAALLLRYNKRLYLLASVTWAEGRSRQASHFLLDRLIYEFAASDMVLDFEGSDLPGVAHFYSNFGGIDQPYFFFRYNRLPWWLRWIKKQDSR